MEFKVDHEDHFSVQGTFILPEIAITTQMPPHVSCEYKLDCVVHKFIVGKLIFMAMNALYNRCTR